VPKASARISLTKPTKMRICSMGYVATTSIHISAIIEQHNFFSSEPTFRFYFIHYNALENGVP
jgi:hypothetical protein